MQTATESIVQLTDRRVDLVRQQVLHADGSSTALTTREAQLLGYLFARAETDVSRDELLEQVWEYRANYATRAVDVAMRRLRSKVEPDPSNPVHLISVHGVGYRFVPPPEEELTRFVTPAPPPARTTNLRADRSHFFGREAELTKLGDLFTQGARLISVLGPGGVGKTRLALAAARLALQASDGVWSVDLTDARDADGILAAVGKTLSIPLSGDDPDALVDLLGRAFAARGRLLLVLDNVEHLVDAATPILGRWMQLAPHTRFLVTSRERLRLQGEQTLELPPLGTRAARELFLDRAAAVGADLTTADPALVDRIIQKLDGLPLAIELAAPRARVLSLDQLLDRLASRFKVLAGHSPDGAPSRSSTLRHAIDWSWQLLTEHERAAMAQCSVFVGGFTLEAAEAVIALPPDAPWTLDLVEALRDKSLLRVYEPDELPGELRFGMYESIREYAAERLAARGIEEEAHARHAAHTLEVCGELGRRVETHGGLASFLQLAVETPNLLAVHDRRIGVEPLEGLAAVVALGPVLRVRGPASLYRRLLDSALAVASELGDRHALAQLLLDRAKLLRMAGQTDDATRDVGEALLLVRESQTELEVDALSLLGMLNGDRSRIDEAEAIVQTALVLAEELGLTRLRGELTGQLGTYAMVRGRSEEAEGLYLDAVRLQTEAGHERGAAGTMSNLGMLYAEFGRLDEAEAYTQRALRIQDAWGARRGRATVLNALSGLQARRGQLEAAEQTIAEALRAFDDVGYTRMAAVCRANLATLRWAMRREVDVVGELHQALQVHTSTGDRVLESMTLTYLTAVLASAGDLEGARRWMTASEESLQGIYVRQAAGMQVVARGFLEMAEARAASDPARARQLLASAREKAAHGMSSHVLGISFFAGILERELDRATP